MSARFRPLNVCVCPNTPASDAYAQLPVLPAALAPGLPPTPDHDLVYHGGKTIAHLTYTNFYIGAESLWKPEERQSIDGALAAAMTDPGLNKVIAQYFQGHAVETIFQASHVLGGARPRVVTQRSIETTVTRLLRKGALRGFDLTNTVFNFLLPSGSVLNDNDSPHADRHLLDESRSYIPFEDEASSLQGLGGYHGSVHVATSQGRQTVYYAVAVYSERLADGSDNGIVAFDKPWKNVVATLYHELHEARTDPDVGDVIKGTLGVSALGWTSRQGEEVGDYPVFEAGNDLGKVFKEVTLNSGQVVPIQLQYSNAAHGPEGT